MKLKTNLRMQLEKHGITAAQLAKKSGVSKQVLSTWLNGSSPRKIEQVKSVADALGVSIDALCFGPEKQIQVERSDEWLSGVFEVKVRKIRD